MLRLRRLRLAGSRPLIVQISYLPLPLAAGLAILDDHAVLPGDAVAITADRSAGSVRIRYILATGPPAAGLRADRLMAGRRAPQPPAGLLTGRVSAGWTAPRAGSR